jgi:hypothetical protein
MRVREIAKEKNCGAVVDGAEHISTPLRNAVLWYCGIV